MGRAIINGQEATLPDDPDSLLVDVLRGSLALTGTKLVCGAGVCGACTVLLDGVPVASCLLPAKTAEGRSITTVEGIAGHDLHPVQKAFMAHDGLQCGFCTPGFIVGAAAFHDRWRAEKGTVAPSREEIGAALSGHLCRCGAYDGIFRAVGEACAGRFDGPATAPPRVEAAAKVTGAAKYTVDIAHTGQLEGRILRSRVAHGRVRALDLAPARAMPGVRAAISLLSPDGMLRYVGQEVAAVAATDWRTANAALEAIKLDVEVLPAVIGPDAARKPGAPLVYSGWRKKPVNSSEGPLLPTPWKGNIRGPSNAFALKPKEARRLVDEARAGRDPNLVEHVYKTAAQQHTCLEPHAAVARFDGDRLTVHISTQGVSHMRELIAKKFKLPSDKVQVIAEHVGGGFGSKGMLTLDTVVAVKLAQAAGAPVRVALDRHEELSVTGYRPGAEMHVSLLPGSKGELKAVNMTAYGDTGVSVASTIATLARLIYKADAKDLADFDVVSNLPAGSPFRGPGGPPMAFALEQAVDEAALRLQSDPIALRRQWDPDPLRQRLYAWASDLETWRSRRASGAQTGRYRRGVGVAAGFWLYLWQPGTKVKLSVRKGRLVAQAGVQDMGTGSRSVIANTVAHAFGLDASEVEVEIGRSDLPAGPTSGGSRTTASVIPPLLIAADHLKRGMQRAARQPATAGSNAPWRELIAAAPDMSFEAERPEDATKLAPGISSPIKDIGLMGGVFGWLMRTFAHIAVGAGLPSSVQVAEVEVDTLLGHVRVTRMYSGLAVGRLAAPLLARSQAAGSIIQGVGYALYEGREVDPVTGHILSGGLEDYRIPGIADTPLMDVHFDEAGFEHVGGGSAGIGEVATVPTSPAIANAVHNAIGVRLTELPMRPERILQALQTRQGALA